MIIIKKKYGFHNFAEHLQKARGTPIKNQWVRRLNIYVSKSAVAKGLKTDL